MNKQALIQEAKILLDDLPDETSYQNWHHWNIDRSSWGTFVPGKPFLCDM